MICRKMSEVIEPTTDSPMVDVAGEAEVKTAEVSVTEANGQAIPTEEAALTKRQKKKQLKLAKFEWQKKEKRAKERLKRKEKRALGVAQGLPSHSRHRKILKANTMIDSTNPIRVAVDMDYDDFMQDKDISKCAKQLLWVYATNRKSAMPLQLYYTSLREKSRILEALERNDGYVNWDVHLKSESYLEVFDRTSIVYLTSDSDTVLETLDQNAVYIIGGLVDHNHHKGLSLKRADEQGIKTARLPLSENITMKTRTVLTIVHGLFIDDPA